MPTVSQKIITHAIIMMKRALITYPKNTYLIVLKFFMPISDYFEVSNKCAYVINEQSRFLLKILRQ